MPASPVTPPSSPQLTFAATVALRLEAAISVGETPDGVRMQFAVRGTVDGPKMKGDFAPGTLAFLRIDQDGVGTINVRAPLLFKDGARAELEATGRYDFGEDGYSKAKQGPEHLPDSDLGWCPRLVTSDERYLWLNRTQFLGVGRLVPSETRVDYDLFVIGSPTPTPAAPAVGRKSGSEARPTASLYERLGRREGIYRLMSASIDSLHTNEQLNRQNPKLASANAKLSLSDFKEKVTDFICKLSGGPCLYRGRTMKASHSHLDITDADWHLFIEDTAKVMRTLGVAPLEQDDLLALLGSLRGEIVKPASTWGSPPTRS